MKKLFIFFIFLTFNVHAANDAAKIRAELASEQAKSKKLDAQIRASDRDIANTQKELVRVADKLSSLESDRNSLKRDMSALVIKDERLQKTISEGRARLTELTAGLLEIAAAPADSGDGAEESLASAILLSGIADSFEAELADSARAAAELAANRREMAAKQRSLEFAADKAAMEKMRLDKLLASRAAQGDLLGRNKAETDARLRALAERAKNIADLSDQIQEGERPELTAKSNRMRLPVRGQLVRVFGEKSPLGIVSDGWHFTTWGGETIVAPDDARVEFADNFRGRNKVLILSHKNGYYTVLAQLDTLLVAPGQNVLAGEPVGRMPSGQSELYLELRRAKSAVDPSRLFDKPKGKGWSIW
ncbi:MAG: peptidoglycan DD-metalloendopeptidase family protein [Rickettsiales bacterium]|nr:peptidoglycan DD-metalloendopeptidase family protein [Rickettsiales bacterium]